MKNAASNGPTPERPRRLGGIVAVLREEPKIRAYLVATMIDAVGIAASIWAAQLIMATVFVDQRTRASLVIPTLVSSLAGTLVAGPLADWRANKGDLARWRWKLVLGARLVETLALCTLLPALATKSPTVGALLPYFVVSSFLKMSVGSTRVALEVDLLQRAEVQTDEDGKVLRDERGEPLLYKVHLLSLGAMLSAVQGVAAMGGLLLGGRIIALAGGRYWPLFAFDVVTNLGFLTIVFSFCRPDGDDAPRASVSPPDGGFAVAVHRFFRSLREVFAFISAQPQRPLLWVMACAWMIELFGEFYDDKMILKHIMGASDDGLWRAEVVWTLASFVPSLLLPILSRRLAGLGKLFIFCLLFDGAVIVAAGGFASTGGSVIVPFAAALALDRSLTTTSKTLASLVQNSASSPAMRGRLAAAFGLVVLTTNILVQSGATVVAERVGIPRMIMIVGVCQIAVMLGIALAGRLWSFGLRTAA